MPNKACFKDYRSLMFSGRQASLRAKPCLRYGTNSDKFLACFVGYPATPINPFTLIAELNSTPVCIIYDNENNILVSLDVPYSGIYIIKPNNPTPVLWIDSNQGFLNLPVALCFNATFTELYVVDFGNSVIYQFDVKTKTLMNTLSNSNLLPTNPLDFPNGPLQLPNGGAMDSTFSNLYVTNTKPGSNNVIRINLTTFEVTLVANIPFPILICFNSLSDCFFVSSSTTNSVYIITNGGFGITSPYIVGGELSAPRGVAVDNACEKLFVTNYNQDGTTNAEINYISVYNIVNINSPTFLYNIIGSVLNEPRGVCFNYNDNNNLLISNFGSDTIYKCNLPKYSETLN
jgi:hypothetical protein